MPAAPPKLDFAIRDEVIAAVGTVDEIERYVGPDTTVVDLGACCGALRTSAPHLLPTSSRNARLEVDQSRE